jgi:hypothetical protein
MNLDAWRRIGASDTLLNWLDVGVPFIPLKNITPPPFYIPSPKFSQPQTDFIRSEIATLLQKGYIEPTDNPYCVSPLKCVSKKNGKLRLCHNLFHLNTFSEAPKFQYEGIDTVSQLISANDCLATVDLKDGFYHIKLHVDHRKYFGFYFDKKYYQWTVCPFGWNASPYYFTKVIRTVISFIRSNDIRAVLYVDDLLLMSQRNNFTDHRDFILQCFDELSLQVNFD